MFLVRFKMVGVYCWLLWVVVMTANAIGTNSKNAPESCKSLGVYSTDCSNKNLYELPKDLPIWVSELFLNHNRIQHLDKNVLSKLVQLKNLKLNRNLISNISSETFKQQTQLEILEINRNQLREIYALSFSSLGKLTTLKLRRNNIELLHDGAFWGVENIDSLELDYNRISAVSRSWVYGLNHLKKLTLSYNIIVQIDIDVWEFCKDLVELNLSSNQIGSLHKYTFKYLSRLERLNLNNNNISHIEEDTFINTPNLKMLWLNYNKLSWTVEDQNRAFIGLQNLERFHLAGNQIKSIDKNAFYEFQNITTLDLSHNNISTLQNNAFADVHNLKELVLNTSNLLCDCNLQWFAAWLRKNSFTRTHAVCAYPLWLREKPIQDIPIANLTCDDVPKPRLMEEPKVKKALKGDNVSLYCKAVSSSPGEMTFVWKRDNIELHDASVNLTATSPDGRYTEYTSELKLFNVAQSDQGTYQCVVTNSFGTTYSQKSRLSVLIFPKFSKKPSNMTVHAGETARLECAAHGEPHPQIAWQKDGGNDFPAARERRMHVMPTDDVFFIVNVKIVDMGVYSCTAQNPAGVQVANASLTVLEVPSFVKPMENKEIIAGNPIVLECMASGSPKPTLTWLKDGGPLRATERHFFTAEDQLMIIVDTSLSDAGRYECFMNNSLGFERGYSELTVIPGQTVTEDDMLGIIIITVVCCAVGTSVVWVVIIYQTRKRVITTPKNIFPMAEVDTRVYVDTSSEHSSCKDSGTGDSAKHSSISDNFTLLSERENNIQSITITPAAATTTVAADCVPNSNAPLLVVQHNSPRSTNHDRDQEDAAG